MKKFLESFSILSVILVLFGMVGCMKRKTFSSLLVYCGAGMRKPMDEIGLAFQREYGVKIACNYGGSNTLLSQMELTKRGNIYMPGATYYIDIAREKGFISYQRKVAYHIPVIAVPEGNPGGIICLNDLAREGVKVVLGDAKAAAIGRLTKKILEKNKIFDKVKENVVAYGATVNELVVYISLKQADASIIWKASLFGTEEKTDIIAIPREQNIIKIVPIGILTFSENKDIARKFVDFVTSEKGKAIFVKCGFTPYLENKAE